MTTIILESKSAVLEQHVRAESEGGPCVLYQCVVCVGLGALCMYTLCVSGQVWTFGGHPVCVRLCIGWVLACVLWISVLSENIVRAPCLWVSACGLLCGLESGGAHCPGKMFLNGV